MSVDRFLVPRLTGARFEGGAIPLEFLKDLAVLEEMIIEVAKAEFLKDHPGRERSPRGFTEGVEFKLTQIEDGSAKPIIGLFVAATTLFAPESQMYFERARESVISAIRAAEQSQQNQAITSYLPEKTLGYFDRIGRSLRGGEAMEFCTPKHTTPARLTKDTRRRLILASSAVKELTEETSVRGSVPEADQDDMSFEVQLVDGHKIKAPISAQHLDTILGAFNGYKSGTRVMLQGVGRFSRNERLLRFDTVEHVSILDPLDIPARLDELRLLKDGWHEGQGMAPTSEGLDWLSSMFGQYYPDELVYPYLYPTVEGGVRAEWTIMQNEVTLDIDLAAHKGSWHCLAMDTDQEEEFDLNLDCADDWKRMTGRIREMNGGVA
jgi:hypothetical protein